MDDLICVTFCVTSLNEEALGVFPSLNLGVIVIINYYHYYKELLQTTNKNHHLSLFGSSKINHLLFQRSLKSVCLQF